MKPISDRVHDAIVDIVEWGISALFLGFHCCYMLVVAVEEWAKAHPLRAFAAALIAINVTKAVDSLSLPFRQ